MGSFYTFTSLDYYGMLNYRLTDWLELGTSYSVSYDDKDDKDGENMALRGLPKAAAWRKDLAVSAVLISTNTGLLNSKVIDQWFERGLRV